MSHPSWKQGLLLAACAMTLAIPLVSTAADSEEELAERIGDGDPVAGKEKSRACQSCHGGDGNSANAETPKLSGQYAAYTLKQLLKFRFGERKHTGVDATTAAIGSDDLADIAAYFASQPRTPAAASTSTASLAENLFRRGDNSREILPCTVCHGSTGQGGIAGSDANPAIGGQHAAYLLKQIQQWRSGGRTGSTAMSLTTKALSDAEIEALSQYLSVLH